MKSFIPAMLIVLLASAPVFARENAPAPGDSARAAPVDTTAVSPSAPRADALSQVVGLEQKRRAAMVAGDTSVLRTIIAEEATYVHATGIMQKRDELLRLLENKTIRYVSFDVEKTSYQVYGDTVVGTGAQHIQVVSAGKTLLIHSRYTVVYTMRGGVEQMIAYQSTPLPEMTSKK